MSISPETVSDILTTKQEESLRSLRELVGDRLPLGNTRGRIYDDLMLLRFLRAREFNVQKAADLLLKDLEWRKKNEVDDILETFPKNKYFSSLFSYYPGALHKEDKRGMPVYYERISYVQPKSLFTQVPKDVVVRFHIWYSELSEKVYREHVAKKGIKYDHNGGYIFVEDMGAIGWGHMDSAGIKTLQECMQIDNAHYPEGLHKMYIINAPSIFSMFWKILKPFADPRTLEKIDILGSDFLNALTEKVPIENIPSVFGGKCVCEKGCLNGVGGEYKGYTDGGLPVEDELTEGKPVEVVIPSRSVHEEVVKVTQPNTTIFWHFRTVDYDIGFSVHHVEKDVTLSPPQRVTSQLEPIQGKVTLDQAGTLLLRWDNSYSALRKKKVVYRIAVQSKEEGMPERADTPDSSKSEAT